MTEPEKNYWWGEFQRENKPKRHCVGNAINNGQAQQAPSSPATANRRPTGAALGAIALGGPLAAGGWLPRAAALGTGRPECRMAAGLLPRRGGGPGRGRMRMGTGRGRRCAEQVNGQRRYSAAARELRSCGTRRDQGD